MCEAALTPSSALLTSQLEHCVVNLSAVALCLTLEAALQGRPAEQSVVRAPRGMTKEERNWMENQMVWKHPKGGISGRAFSWGKLMKNWKGQKEPMLPGVWRFRLLRHLARGTQDHPTSGCPFWPLSSAIRHMLLVASVLAKEVMPGDIPGTEGCPTTLLWHGRAWGMWLASSSHHTPWQSLIPTVG